MTPRLVEFRVVVMLQLALNLNRTLAALGVFKVVMLGIAAMRFRKRLD